MPASNLAGRSSRKNRTPTSLDQKLDRRLIGYAAAASAAGVGMIAAALPSQAEVVYTPTHQTITSGESLTLDLNNDGIADFTLHSQNSSCISTAGCRYQQLKVIPNGRNHVLLTYGGMSYARALKAHKKVGPGTDFGRFSVRMDRCKATRISYYVSGSWAFAKSAYLGLQFSIGGRIHYGWARLTFSISGTRCKATALLTGYAYETVPGKPIITGKTSGAEDASARESLRPTLGVLAVGSTGLVAWRRDDDAER